jgi:hypothetical protein
VQQINTPKVEQGQSAQAIQQETLPDKDGKLQVNPDAVQPTALLEKEVQAKFAPAARSLTAYPRISDLQMKSLPVLVQQETMDDEDLQMKQVESYELVSNNASTGLTSAINSARGRGQPLEPSLQRQMGQAMGVDFHGVKIHTNDRADSLNKSLQSRAFTTKQDIFFKQGEYKPWDRQGQELIAHELTHVVQQGEALRRQSDITYGVEDFTDVPTVGEETPLQHQNISSTGSTALIQRTLVKIKGVKIGKTRLYNANGQEVGNVRQGVELKVEDKEEPISVETKHGYKTLVKINPEYVPVNGMEVNINLEKMYILVRHAFQE